ncbi:MAG: putative Diguanylate cyclase [Pseudomonadota bacterium]|nr:putative Diguanylate cyclase [Pseudomonadota bacterium]
MGMEIDNRQRSLRERAEALLNQVHENRLSFSTDEIGRLIQDLSVYQIELELQNEDLRGIQHQLEATRDRYAQLYHQAPVGYLSLDRRGIIQQVNQTLADLLGCEGPDLIDQALADFMVGADREMFLSRFRAFFNQPAHKTIDTTLHGQHGRSFQARLTGRQDLEERSALLSEPRLLTVVHDISEQQALEDALRESRAFQELLLETLPTPVFYKDLEGRYLGCNPAFTVFMGRSKADIIGKTAYDIAPKALADIYQAQDRNLLQGPANIQIFQSSVVNTQGEWQEALFYKARIVGRQGQLRGLIGVILDITERQCAEEALREQSAILRGITDSAQDAIVMLDTEGRISFWNPAAERIFGYTQDEALGQDLHQLLAPDRYHEAHHQAFSEFRETGRGNAVGKTLELCARHKDGSEIAVALSLSAVHIQNQWRGVGILRDETQRQAQERELRRLATTDHLTGMANRRHFLKQVDLELQRFKRYAAPATLLMVDLDHFKRINDTCGHAAGDQTLQHFASIAQTLLRYTDLIGRLGGEEFAILLPATGLEGARLLAERLRGAVANTSIPWESRTIELTVSIGVTRFSSTDEEPGSILNRADRALYQAKEQGRNQTVVLEPTASAAHEFW